LEIKKRNTGHLLSLFNEHWSPKIIEKVNNHEIKLVKILGDFEWHSHKDSDEMFFVIKGNFTMHLRLENIFLEEGDFIVVPKGVEHRPSASEECEVMLIEHTGIVNTGDGPLKKNSTKGNWIK